ncbi:MAG: hypothetical protein ACE5K4_09115 [Candidatus Hydrothermarchaeota archaeon]
MPVFYVEKENYKKVRSIVEKDPFIRHTVYLKDAGTLGFEKTGYYLYLSAPPDIVEEAKEKLEELANLVEEKESEKVIEAIKSEEEKVEEGVGFLFGD